MDSLEHRISGKVDVVIPAYQAEKTLRRSMDSVRLQGDVVHRVFIVDNASKDRTASVARAYIDEHHLKHWQLLQESRLGAPAARNRPLPFLQAEWVQFLDADDELLEGKLTRQVAFAEAAGCDVVVGGAIHVHHSGSEIQKLPEPKVRLALISGKCGITSANLFRSRSVHGIDGWDESLSSSQEYDLMFRLWLNGARFQTIATPLTRIHEAATGRITTSNLPKKWLNHCEVQRRMLLAFLQREEHSADELERWLQSHFGCIRILYQYQASEAIRLFREQEFRGFVPQVNDVNSLLYVLLFRMFGFRGAERVRLLLKKPN